MKKLILAIMVPFAVFVLGTAAHASLGNILMEEERADALVAIEVPNPEIVFEKLGNLLAQFNQDSTQLKSGIAAKMFQIPDATLVDFDKPVELIIINPKKYKVPIIIAFSVTNKEKFLKDFGTMEEALKLNPETKDSKIREYTKTETEFDHKAYMKDLEEGKEVDFEDYQKEVTRSYFVSFVGNLALGTGDKGLMDKTIAVAGKTTKHKYIVTGDMRGTVNIEAVLSIYAEEIAKLKSEMDVPQEEDMPMNPAEIIQAYADALTAFASSTQTIEFAASLTKEGDVDGRLGFIAKPETPLARFIAAQTPGKYGYLMTLPEDSAMAYGWNLELTEEFTEGYIGFIRKVFDSFGSEVLTEEKMDEAIGLIKDYFAVMGSGGALSFGFTEDGLDLRSIVEITDKAKAMKGTKDSMAFMMESIMKPLLADMDLTDELGVEYKEAIENYKGATINKLLFKIPMEEISEEARQVLDKVWGEEPAMYFAFAEKVMTMGFGPKGLDIVKATIDSVGTPQPRNVTTSAGYKSATAGFPKEGIMVFYMSLGKVMKGVMTFAPEEERSPQADMMMQMFENIHFAGYLTKKENALVFGLKVPVSEFVKMAAGMMMPPIQEDVEIEEDIEED